MNSEGETQETKQNLRGGKQMIKTYKEIQKENFANDCKELGIELEGKTRLQALCEFEEAMVSEYGSTGLVSRIVSSYREWL